MRDEEVSKKRSRKDVKIELKKMLMMATTAAMIEQFNKDNILILEKLGYEVHVLGNFYEENPISDERLDCFKKWIVEHHGKWFHYPATRRPVDFKNIKAYAYTVKLIKKYHYEFIHCHTPIGSVIARMAAHKTQTRIIYTAHGFHFYKGAPLKNWIFYYPVEKMLSRWTDVLITINQEDYQRAKSQFNANRIVHIPGVGINISNFNKKNIEKENKCKELGVLADNFIFLSVGELQKRKNYGIVIKALGKIQDNRIIYLIAGKGPLQKKYEKMIRKYHLENNIKLLGYRTDIPELCGIADCFIHVAFHEGASVAVLEAMASRLPVIASDVRGVRELIDMGKGGLCVNPESVEEVEQAVMKMYHNREFRKKCAQYNYCVVDKYNIQNISEIMKSIYVEMSLSEG